MVSSQYIYATVTILLSASCVTSFRIATGAVVVSPINKHVICRVRGGEIDEYSAQLDSIKSKIMSKAN
jgi:hypothetical protein